MMTKVSSMLVRNVEGLPSVIWAWFTDNCNSQSKKSMLCKNGKYEVNHHKKSEYHDKKHLNSLCPGFRPSMMNTKLECRLDWFMINMKGGKPYDAMSVAEFIGGLSTRRFIGN